jgi:hypothetical protein
MPWSDGRSVWIGHRFKRVNKTLIIYYISIAFSAIKSIMMIEQMKRYVARRANDGSIYCSSERERD